MRDCQNAEMRDRLPDLLNDRLAAAERAEVHAHLNTCVDCREELGLLQQLRSATPSHQVDVNRIVAALPAYKAAPAWRSVTSVVLQIAAAIVLLAGGTLWLLDRRPVDVAGGNQPVAVSPTSDTPAARETPRPMSRLRAPATEPPATELAVGAMFDDLTDAELETLLRSMGALETLTPVETEVVVPAVNRSGT